MIDQFPHTHGASELDADFDEIDLPDAPLDLSARLRELRARQGLKQSEVARRMGLDPSIPSLWEQGKRPVPAGRIRSLADALHVSVGELLQGVEGVGASARDPFDRPDARRGTRLGGLSLVDPGFRSGSYQDFGLLDGSPLLTLVSASSHTPTATPLRVASEPVSSPEPLLAPRPFVPLPRPRLSGFVPAGWEPTDRAPEILPSLPDGFWLDPVRLEKSAARALLRARLCAEDRASVDGKEVPGAALAERIYRHCGRQAGEVSDRLPLMEALFRAVLQAEYGGLTVDQILESPPSRSSGRPLTRALLKRLGQSVLPYPMRWVDRELFGAGSQ